ISPNFIFDEVTAALCTMVSTSFDRDARTKSSLALSTPSTYTYINQFKACLKSAFNDGYLTVNLAQKLKSFEQEESQREYFTFEELQKLIITDCKYPVLKNAFLFSCLSGLRWSDCNKLIWSEVRDEGNGVYRINFRQQ